MATNRKKRLNINDLTIEQADELSGEIGSKINAITDKAINKINTLLSKYGMIAKVAVVLEPLESAQEERQS